MFDANPAARSIHNSPFTIDDRRLTTETNPPSDRSWNLLFACWLLVTGATLGSLFFSEVMELPPCSLCWVQRIFMFPLAIVLFVGLFPFDAGVVRYGLPLSVSGFAIAAYHWLLQLGVIPESAAPCQQGVSCSEVSLELFGFISIPMMSLLVFSIVTVLLIALKRSEPS